jgi:hypothetical protein
MIRNFDGFEKAVLDERNKMFQIVKKIKKHKQKNTNRLVKT